MFALFFCLYRSMFRGTWQLLTLGDISTMLKSPTNLIGEFVTSIFGDVSNATLGNALFTASFNGVPDWINLTSFILALITSIGIVVVATKGIKKLFTVFFYGVR